MSKFIEYESLKDSNAPYYNQLEDAANRVIRSGWYVLGEEVGRFENEFREWLGSKYCIGVGNGLDAITLSLIALGLPHGSEVIVASNTYIATILAIIHAGLVPVLVEPSIDTYNLDPCLIKRSLTKRTKAICVTHLYGKPCRMDEIMKIADSNGLKVVEDCAQSHGAMLGNVKTGRFGVAGCFSFYPTKNLGGFGDAGAVVTDDPDVADRLLSLRNYGSKQKYVNEYVGYNTRLDEMQAALLRVKLKHIDAITYHKRMLAKIYFENLPEWLILPKIEDDEFDVFHIFTIRSSYRNDLRDWLLSNKIKTEIHYPIPPYRQNALRGRFKGEFKISDEIHETVLSLPISIGHSEDDVFQVCEAVNKFALP